MSFILLGILNSQIDSAPGGAYDLLETQILESSASSVTFTGLGDYSDYKHLQIRAVMKSDYGTSDLRTLELIFNNVTTSSYRRHTLEGNSGSGVTSSEEAGTAILFQNILATDTLANVFSAAVIDVLDFSNASKNTTVRALGGGRNDDEGSASLQSGLFNNTAAVTSLRLASNQGNFKTGSRFSLYGVKG